MTKIAQSLQYRLCAIWLMTCRVQSTPTAHLDFDVQGSLRYVDNQYTVVLLKLF